MPSDQELAKVATDEHHRLDQFLTGLAPEDWSRPSACEGWLVSDVVAHLEAIGQSLVDSIGRGLKGDPSEPSDNVPAGSISEDELRERIASRAISLKDRLGDSLLPFLIQWNQQMDELITGLKPNDWDALCYHSMGPEPVRTLVTMRIAETAMHSWDIRSASTLRQPSQPNAFPPWWAPFPGPSGGHSVPTPTSHSLSDTDFWPMSPLQSKPI